MTIELIKENEIAETCEMILRARRHSVLPEYYPPQSEHLTITQDELERDIKEKMKGGHFYVAKENGAIIGCGGIGANKGNFTESRIHTIFVDPAFERQGIGRRIIEFLEADEYAKRAEKIVIHSAISAIPFYRKLGYEHKNGELHFADGTFFLEKRMGERIEMSFMPAL